PSYRLLWVLPVAWLAFYLRYQSILAFGLIGVTMAILWRPRIRARSGPVVAAAMLGVAGLVPHAVFAVSETESPIGILVATGEVAGREFIGEGLVDYALLLGWPLAGLVGLPLFVSFLWWLVRGWSVPEQRRRGLFLAVPALGQVLALGIVSHGEPRFVFFPLALLAVGAVAGVAEVSGSWRPRLRFGVRAGLVVLVFGSVVLSIVTTRGSVENRRLSHEPVEMSAEHVEAVSDGAECGVMTTYLPQVTYYSECSTYPFRTSLPADEAVDRLEGDKRYMILIEDGLRQPIGEHLEELLEETDGEQFLVQGQRESAVVYEFVD
ncbi:MAG TPA: hypothetical protein VK969_10055, partial [Acidimicrobiia bacterium]|nr:hypothetical protein [Acidimicrobiia bacterium]